MTELPDACVRTALEHPNLLRAEDSLPPHRC